MCIYVGMRVLIYICVCVYTNWAWFIYDTQHLSGLTSWLSPSNKVTIICYTQFGSLRMSTVSAKMREKAGMKKGGKDNGKRKHQSKETFMIIPMYQAQCAAWVFTFCGNLFQALDHKEMHMNISQILIPIWRIVFEILPVLAYLSLYSPLAFYTVHHMLGHTVFKPTQWVFCEMFLFMHIFCVQDS